MRRTVCRFGLGAVLAAVGLLAARSAEAQSPPAAPEKISVGDWQLAPSMEVRLRGEYRRDAPDLGGFDFVGQRTPRVRDGWVALERSRLGLGAEHGAVRAQITLQDARALGSPSPTGFAGTRGLGRFEPYEAFAEVHGTGSRPAYVRLGRQAVVWGEGRLIGSADFSPTGRALDAVRGHVAFGAFDVEALAAILEVPGPLGSAWSDTAGPSTSGVQIYGLTGKWSIAPLLKVEAFALARISRSAGGDLDGSRFAASRLSGELATGALRVSGDASGWKYGAEGAYQFGNTSIAGGVDVSAWAAAARVEKTLAELALNPTFHVSGSYASGDDRKGVYKQFDPLLADPQRFHGPMDLFAWSNMMDLGAGVQVVPLTDTTVSLGYRYARLAQGRGEWIGGYMTAIGSTTSPTPVTTTSPATGKPAANEAELGHELDVGFSYRPWTPFELRASWSGLLLGDGAKAIMATHARGERLPNGAISPANIAQYAFLQATVTLP